MGKVYNFFDLFFVGALCFCFGASLVSVVWIAVVKGADKDVSDNI